jgi:4-hydroxy-2-oxoglutarate aldolase
MNISGIFPALSTPFEEDGCVSISGMKHNIRLYNQTGLAGFVVLGSTGEAVMVSRDEADQILAAVKETAAPGKILIAGTGAESTAETIARTKRAASLGYQVALVKTPYYYKPTYRPEHFIHHYRAVADASPIPVLLYSVPIFTNITLEAPEIIALSQHSAYRRSCRRRARALPGAHRWSRGGLSMPDDGRPRRDSCPGIAATGNVR